jgi:hypothetical protein
MSGERVYTRERWEFEGWVGKLKFAFSVEFENDIVYEAGLIFKYIGSHDPRHEIECVGMVFDSDNDIVNICYDILFDTALQCIKQGEDIEVRIGRKEIQMPESRYKYTVGENEDPDEKESLVDVVAFY